MLQKLLSETIGSAFLLISIVGSGIMATNLTEDVALALLANAIATGCALYFIITTLGPVSGGHFNPIVTLMFRLRGGITTNRATGYIVVQIVGGILGVWACHIMFDQPVLQLATTQRTGIALWFSETLSTFGLLFVILMGLKSRPDAVPTLVALYVTGAYWFTSSSGFANPTVTIARSLTDTFSGIAPLDVPAYLIAQMIGLAITLGVLPILLRKPTP